MQYSVVLALSLALVGLPPESSTLASPTLTVSSPGMSVQPLAGSYIRSALFAEEMMHFDDLYLIHVKDGEMPIVIFCNRSYCYRPEDAIRYV